MGSGTSRGKKVAPACASPNASPRRPFKPPQIQELLRNARNRDCRSEARNSDFSKEDDDIEGETDTVQAKCKQRGCDSAKINPTKKSAIRSKTYGLCHSNQEAEEDSSSEEPPGSRVANTTSNNTSPHFQKHAAVSQNQLTSSSRGFLTTEVLVKDVPSQHKQLTSGSCHCSSLATPVTVYDGSEEELMDTIEREFS